MSGPDVYAVVGNPVGHSLSPQIHRAFAQQTSENISYTALLVPVDAFAAEVAAFFDRGGCGLNVTLPFKQQAFAWVDEHDAAAATAGAVNTIVPKPSGFLGCNTDGVGLLADLTKNLALPLSGARVLLLGAGGAAQGVLGPLLDSGIAELAIANRTEAKAKALVNNLDVPAGVCVGWVDMLQPGAGYDLVINATSASIAGSGSIVPAETVAKAHCYDMMYGPATPFCEFAAASGALACYDGLGMLVEQAAAAFKLWRGHLPATSPVLRQLREQGLGRRVQLSKGQV